MSTARLTHPNRFASSVFGTPISDQLGPVINVKGSSYGAVGDGTTDDTTAINAALAAAKATGGQLYFPEGTYKYDDSMLYEATDNKPLRIYGDGPERTILSYTGTDYAIDMRPADGAVYVQIGGGVDNLSIEKNGAGTCNGIRTGNINYGHFYNLELSDCGGVGMDVQNRGTGDTQAAAYCVFERIKAWRCHIGMRCEGDTSGAVPIAQSTIKHCSFQSSDSCNLWLTGAITLTVDHVALTDGGTGANGASDRGGLYLRHDGNTCRNIVFENCEFGNFTTYGNGAMTYVDSAQAVMFRNNRWVKNVAEERLYCVQLGWTGTGQSISDIDFQNETLIFSEPETTYLVGTGNTANVTFGRITVTKPTLNDWDRTYHRVTSDHTRVDSSVDTLVLMPFAATENVTTGNTAGGLIYPVPKYLIGHDLLDVSGIHETAGTGTGSQVTTVQIRVGAATDLLSTELTIDEDEVTSSTAATAAVVDASNAVFAAGDVLRIDVDGVTGTTPPQGLAITLPIGVR